jgi:hypothetical protein
MFPDTTGQNSCDYSAHAFFAYCARLWPMHFREAHIESGRKADILDLALQISDPDSRCFRRWLEENEEIVHVGSPTISQLTIASTFGLVIIVKRLLDIGADVNADTTATHSRQLHLEAESR